MDGPRHLGVGFLLQRLEEKGVAVFGPIDHHFCHSIYFFDPDGILLEFAAWTRELRPDDVKHVPARAVGAAGAPTA